MVCVTKISQKLVPIVNWPEFLLCEHKRNNPVGENCNCTYRCIWFVPLKAKHAFYSDKLLSGSLEEEDKKATGPSQGNIPDQVSK